MGVRTSHDEVAKPDLVLGLEALKSFRPSVFFAHSLDSRVFTPFFSLGKILPNSRKWVHRSTSEIKIFQPDLVLGLEALKA